MPGKRNLKNTKGYTRNVSPFLIKRSSYSGILPPSIMYIPQSDKEFYENEDKKLKEELRKYYKSKQPKRVRDNVSKTSDDSAKVEDRMNNYIYNIDTPEKWPTYTIPYIEDKEISINGHRTTENVLDTLWKYSNNNLNDFRDLLGLAGQETQFGAIPVFNYGMSGIPNRVLGNTNYFKSYNHIPTNNLIRNFAWLNTNRSEHPLVHGLRYFKAGKYNPGDKNHTNDVIKVGNAALNSEAVKNFLNKKRSIKANGGKVYLKPF